MSKEKTYHYVYKVTNLINQKIYIGKHSTQNLDDDYMGSGKLLQQVCKKYRKENFKKEILKFFNSSHEAFKYERKIVNDEFVLREDTYNIHTGGGGGVLGMVSVKNKNETTTSVSCSDPRYISGELKHISEGSKQSEETKNKISLAQKGKKHSKETKKKQSISQKEKKNSQYGTIWITNLDKTEDRKIKKDLPIPKGWQKGREKNAISNKGKSRITNGKINKYINLNEEVPEGFWKGIAKNRQKI